MSSSLEKNPSVWNWNESDWSPFYNFPIELFYQIFDKLDVGDLKLCREVCSFWNSILMSGQLFKNRTCAIYKGGTLSIWGYVKRDIDLETGKSYLLGNHLRITGVSYLEDFCFLKTWLALSKLDTMTRLELVCCDLTVNDFADIFAKFKHLTELSLHYVTEAFSFITPIGTAANFSESQLVLKNKLKKLDIRTSYSWAMYSRISGVIHGLATNCFKLESLHLECLDTGHPRIDLRGQYKVFFKSICRFLIRNSNSLKELSVKTYDVENSRLFSHMICQKSELPRLHNSFLFEKFLQHIDWKEWREFKSLKKISFNFRLAMIDRLPLFQTVFLPFLKKMVTLNQFSLTQVCTKNEDDFIQSIRQNIPLDCRCEIGKLYYVRPAVHLLSNHQDLDQELNRLIGNSKNHLLEQPNCRFPKDLTKGLLGYYDSTVRLETNLNSWTILYSRWKSIGNINFFKRNLETLTKIKIQQCGVFKSDKLKLNDLDIQTIFKISCQLTHLEVEYCDLSAITDFGLTGISPAACERMLKTKNYKTIQDGDLIGHSVADLKFLRVLKLGDAGAKVTDISVHHAFGGADFTWLRKFKTRGLRKSIEGLRVL